MILVTPALPLALSNNDSRATETRTAVTYDYCTSVRKTAREWLGWSDGGGEEGPGAAAVHKGGPEKGAGEETSYITPKMSHPHSYVKVQWCILLYAKLFPLFFQRGKRIRAGGGEDDDGPDRKQGGS